MLQAAIRPAVVHVAAPCIGIPRWVDSKLAVAEMTTAARRFTDGPQASQMFLVGVCNKHSFIVSGTTGQFPTLASSERAILHGLATGSQSVLSQPLLHLSLT